MLCLSITISFSLFIKNIVKIQLKQTSKNAAKRDGLKDVGDFAEFARFF